MSASIKRRIIPIGKAIYYTGQRVNVAGVVVEFSFPRKSNGTDYYSILKIVDESQQTPELSVNIFTAKPENLPHVKSYSDLILLYNVTIEMFDGRVCVVFNKRFSSFALFHGGAEHDLSCYQLFRHFSLPRSQKISLMNVRSWFSTANFDSGKSNYLVSLNSVSDTCFDLVCKVLHAFHEASSEQLVLFVWDGTDVPELSLIGNGAIDEDQCPIPLRVESFCLERDTLSKLPPIGTILRVYVDKTYVNLGTYSETIVGKWVRVRNMECKVSYGMWYGSLRFNSRIRLLSEKDGVIEEKERNYKQRKLKSGRLPLCITPPSITVIDFEDAEPVTLMDVLSYPEDDAMFYCVVRVVAICPLQVEGSSLLDGTGESRMRLTLEDPTARIHAFLRGEYLVEFFGDCPLDGLTAKMKRLLGVPENKTLDGDDNYRRLVI